ETAAAPAPKATDRPSGENRPGQARGRPARRTRPVHAAGSQSRTVPSKPAEASSLPSGEKASATTLAVWPERSLTSPEAILTRTIASLPLHARTWLSGENATHSILFAARRARPLEG